MMIEPKYERDGGPLSDDFIASIQRAADESEGGVMIPDNRLSAFHEGQVWENSRGFIHKVVAVKHYQATLKAGLDGTGRASRRPWDAVIGWVLHYDPCYPDHRPLGSIDTNHTKETQ